MPCMPACLPVVSVCVRLYEEQSSLERIWLQVCPASDGIWDIFAEIIDKLLRHVDHVARLESDVLVKVFACKYLFKIEPLDTKVAVGSLMKEEYLGFGSRRESPSNRDRFSDCNFVAQIILTRLTYLARDGKERLLEVFKINIDDRIV